MEQLEIRKKIIVFRIVLLLANLSSWLLYSKDTDHRILEGKKLTCPLHSFGESSNIYLPR